MPDGQAKLAPQSRYSVEVKVRSGEGVRMLVFESLADAHRSLLRAGTRFEVLEPPELRTLVAETARELVALYSQ